MNVCACFKRFDQKALKRVTLFIKFSLFEGRKKTGNNASCVSYTYQYHNLIIKTQENLMGYSQVLVFILSALVPVMINGLRAIKE